MRGKSHDVVTSRTGRVAATLMLALVVSATGAADAKTLKQGRCHGRTKLQSVRERHQPRQYQSREMRVRVERRSPVADIGRLSMLRKLGTPPAGLLDSSKTKAGRGSPRRYAA